MKRKSNQFLSQSHFSLPNFSKDNYHSQLSFLTTLLSPPLFFCVSQLYNQLNTFAKNKYASFFYDEQTFTFNSFKHSQIYA